MKIQILPGAQFAGLTVITIARIITALVTLSMILAAISFFFSVVTGGLKWMLSGGSKEKVDEAKRQLTNAFIGLLIVFSAWAIVNLVSVFFGVEILVLEIPSAVI